VEFVDEPTAPVEGESKREARSYFTGLAVEMAFDGSRRFRFAARVAGCKIRRKLEDSFPVWAGDAKFGGRRDFVAGWAHAAAFSGSRRLILGQAEERDPKETESEAQLSRRSNRQGKQSKRVNGLGRRQDCRAEPEGYFTGLA